MHKIDLILNVDIKLTKSANSQSLLFYYKEYDIIIILYR